jgi:hypothetical protein
MNTQIRHIMWLGLLSVLVLVLIVVTVWAYGEPLAVGATGAPQNGPTALTPGQNAAIQGAGQLLLFSSGSSQVYLPLIRR